MVACLSNSTETNDRPSRGWKRMRELRAEAAREREALTVEILASLGRVPSAIDRIAAANLAALHVRANRIEASGRDASAIRQQITQAVRATGFKPAPAGPQKPNAATAGLDYLREAYGQPTNEGAR